MLLSTSQMYSKLFRPWDAAIEEEKLKDRREAADAVINEQVTSDRVDMPAKAISNLKSAEYRIRRHGGEKGNKLRKIRSKPQDVSPSKNTLHQDCTISTTTEESAQFVESSYLPHNRELNIRLGLVNNSASECSLSLTKIEKLNDKRKLSLPKLDLSKCKEETKSNNASPSLPAHHNYPLQFQQDMMLGQEYLAYPVDGYSPHVQRYPMELLTQAELAQTLGIPPSDPLLMESFAQGYAMELEYARIMHQENQAKLLNARKQRPKKYRCPHCDVGFSNNGQLKGHIRIHTGERPFKCDDKSCGKTFTRNEELTRHRRIHSGLRPYPCQACGKKFGRRDHLKKHTRTHMVHAERMMPMFVPLSAMPQLAGYPYGYGY